MKRTLLAAGAAASLLLSLGGVAFAADDEAAPRLCSEVSQALVDAEAAATLPVTIGGAKFTSLPALQQFLDSLSDAPVFDDSRAAAQAVLDAAADVEVLKQEQKTCTPDSDPTTEEPPASEEPTPTEEPTETLESTTPAPEPVLYENCDAVRAAGVDPLLVTQPGYRTELDADGDGIACEVVEDTGSGVDTGSGSNSGEFADSVPSGSIDTGAF